MSYFFFREHDFRITTFFFCNTNHNVDRLHGNDLILAAQIIEISDAATRRKNDCISTAGDRIAEKNCQPRNLTEEWRVRKSTALSLWYTMITIDRSLMHSLRPRSPSLLSYSFSYAFRRFFFLLSLSLSSRNHNDYKKNVPESKRGCEEPQKREPH